jgi:arylsulfate sulfotransferase
VELEPVNGAIVNEWDLRQILDVDRHNLHGSDYDWLHINSVWYSVTDDCLVISGRNQGVFKVTRYNELIWILAPHQGWGQSGTDGNGINTTDYLLTAEKVDGTPFPENLQSGEIYDDDFSWPWGQHAAMYLPNGNLFLFDNGLKRNFSNTNRYSRGVEYQIDEGEFTVTQVWEYGKKRGREFYSAILSDVDLMRETGNRLFTAGLVSSIPGYSLIVEVSYPEAEVVFEAKLTFKNLLVNGSGWGAYDINYRAERMPVYPALKSSYPVTSPFSWLF